MGYFSIELYALTTGNARKYVSGVTVKLYNSNGALVTTIKTNTSGRAQYQTNSYIALSFTANRTGYNEMGGTLTSKTNSTTYDSHQLTPNSPQYLPTSNTWYKIDGEKYIGGKLISQGIYLPDDIIKTTPDTSTNLISSGNSGTSIVEFYLHTTQSSGIRYPKLGIYENNSFATKSNVFDFTNMKVGQDIDTSEYDSKRYVVSTHYIYGKNSTNASGLFVAASNSDSGKNAIAYNYSKNNKNAWTEYKDHGGVNYYSITADENNLKTFTQLSVEKDYIYTFNIHTYSEANYDGVIISNSKLPSSITGLSSATVGSNGVLKKVSGVNKSDTYSYTPSSNGTIYIYFITNTGGLGDTVDTSTGSESKRGYTYADVKVEKKFDGYIFTFSSTKRAFVEGDVIDNDTTTTKTYNSSGPVVLPRPYASDGLFYCDAWVERMTRRFFDVGKEYSISDFKGTQFIASQWENKTKVSIPSGTDKVYSGKDQYWTIIDNKTISVQGTIHATNVGTYSVTLKLIDDVHYVWEDNTLKDKTFTWSITKRPVTITAKSNSKTYDGTAIVPPGGETGGADVITSSNLVSGHVCYAVLSRTGNGILPGTYAYTPTGIKIHVNNQSGADVTSNYSITPKNGAGTVSKYTPTITLNATDRAYNGSSLYATASVSHPTNGKTIKGTIKYGTSSGATTYSATYSGTSVGLSSVHVLNYNESATVYAYFVPDSTCSDCYNQSGSVSKTFKINAKASSKLPTTWGGDSKTYHNTASPTVSGYSGGTLYYRTSSNNSTWGSWTTTKPTRTELGTTYVQCYVKGDNNHNDSGVSSSVSITINKATDAYATIDINSTELTYNGSSQQLTINLSSHGCTTYMALGSSSTSAPTSGWQTSHLYATNAGTYYVWYKFEPDSNHSNSKSATYVGSKTIKRSTTASASVITGFTQDSNNKKYYTGSTQTGVTGSHVSWSGTTSSVNAGDFTATATPESNYAWSDGSTSSKTFYWRIQKVTPITKLTADSGVYTGSTYYCYFSASVNGIVYETWNGNTPTTSSHQTKTNISANANTRINSAYNVGSWTIKTLFVPTDTTNYNNVSDTLTGWHISKRKVRFVADDQSKSWDGSALSASNTATLTKPDSSYYDLVSGQTASFVCSGSQTSVGSSTKTLSSVSIFSGSNNVTGNYTIEKINGTLTVRDAVKSYNPVASLSNNLSAGGGSATLSAQCTRIWASGKTDTVGGTISKVEFITNGNSRFAVSTGNATDFSRVITHSSMGTSVTTDSVQVKVTFANSYTATSNTISVSNAVTSTTKPMLLGINWNKLIPASGGTAVPSFSYTQTRTYTSGSQDYPSSGASISYAPAKCVRLDPEFYNGTNTIYRYDNAGSGKVTMNRVSSGWSGTIPNNSGYALKINHTGSGTAPGMGGWYFAYTGTAGYTYICTFDAWIPSGYNVNFASNATGNETSRTWESQQYGHGRWETYSFKVKYGTSGSISSTFFFYLQPNSSASYPVTWYVANATICQVNDVSSSLVNTSTGAVTLSSRGTSTGSYTANELGAVMMTITLNGQSGSYVLVPTQEKNEIISHSATTSMSNNFSASGGYGNVTGSCTRTYTSGSKDSVGISKVEITSNGNGRFGVSGTKVTHSSMGTSVATDKVSIKTTFTDGSTATASSPDIVNKLESISLTLNPSSIKYGGQSTPTTKATYTSGASDSNVKATYTSSDSNVVKVE